MPFTPFHLGPGAGLKLIGNRYFSFTLFAYSQILMDLEPLVRVVKSDRVIHGMSHSYLGATIIALVACLTGKPACEWVLRLWNETFKNKWLAVSPMLSWRVAAITALLGSYSHVALDSLMYSDLRPWAPFSAANRVLYLIPVRDVYILCWVLGGVGIAGLAVYWLRKNLVSDAKIKPRARKRRTARRRR